MQWENRKSMKLFKRIYYPVLAALIVVMLVLGLVDARYSRPGKTDAAFVEAGRTHVRELTEFDRTVSSTDGLSDARTYITDKLREVMERNDSRTDDDGYTQVDARKKDEKVVPTFTVQSAVLLDASLGGYDAFDNVAVIDKTVNNIVVYIPSRSTVDGTASDAVLMTAHVDAHSEVAASEAVPAAVMLQNIIDIIESERTYANDLVFVFTDASVEGAYGAVAFMQQFKGFDGVVERIKLSADFNAMGQKGTLALYDVSNKNSALIGEYAKINGATYASSMLGLFGFNDSVTATDAFTGPYLGIGTVGGLNASDTFGNLKMSVLKQQAGMMTRFTEKFGNYDLAALDGQTASVFFTYLDLFTVWYPAFVSYIWAAVLIGLIAAIIIVNVKKKSFGLGRSFGGALVGLLSMAASVLTLFVAYYLLGLVLAGFGAFNLHAINNLLFGNIAFLLGAMLLSVAVQAAFTLVLKKTFNVKAADVVRGNVWLWALAGIILGFAAPKYAYIFLFGALFELVVMLLVTIFKDKYKARFKEDIERLFLYNVPLILILPMAIPAIAIASASLKTIFLPLIMLVFMLMTGFITPYLSFLEPVLDKAFKKLPERKIRVEHEVEEEIVDPAKPGKKGEIVTVKKVVTERTPWNYHSWMTVTAAVVLSCLIVIFSTVFTGSFTATAASRLGGDRDIYDDAVVYVWDKSTTGVTAKTLEVHDLDAYAYIARYIDGFRWDSEKKAYVKDDYADTLIASGEEPRIERRDSDNTYTVTPYSGGDRSRIVLRLTGTESVTKLKFGVTADAEDQYEVELNGEDAFEIRLPYGYGAFVMTVEGTTNKLGIEYTENYYGAADNEFRGLPDWNGLTGSGNEKVTAYVRGGIVFRYHF